MKIEWNEHDFVSSTCSEHNLCERTHNLHHVVVFSSFIAHINMTWVFCSPCIIVCIRIGHDDVRTDCSCDDKYPLRHGMQLRLERANLAFDIICVPKEDIQPMLRFLLMLIGRH